MGAVLPRSQQPNAFPAAGGVAPTTPAGGEGANQHNVGQYGSEMSGSMTGTSGGGHMIAATECKPIQYLSELA